MLVVNYEFEMFHLKDVELLKMIESQYETTTFKHCDMMSNRRIIFNAKFELVSPIQIVMSHGKYIWLNDFQFQLFNIWRNNTITKYLIDECN